MNCTIRKWRLSDAADLAAALSNPKVLNNLRDGLPYPYTQRDAEDYIRAMLSADENNTFAFAVTPFEGSCQQRLCVLCVNDVNQLLVQFGSYPVPHIQKAFPCQSG